MPCVTGTTPDGHTYFACSRGPAARCQFCGRSHTALCDYPDERHSTGTCDAKLCPAHRRAVGRNKEYCPPHAALVRAKDVPPIHIL